MHEVLSLNVFNPWTMAHSIHGLGHHGHSALQYLVLMIYLCEVFNGILLGILPCDGLLPWLLADRLTSFLLLSSLLTSALEATVGGRDPLKFGVEVWEDPLALAGGLGASFALRGLAWWPLTSNEAIEADSCRCSGWIGGGLACWPEKLFFFVTGFLQMIRSVYVNSSSDLREFHIIMDLF